MSKKRSHSISMIERLQATHGLVPSGCARGVTMQPHPRRATIHSRSQPARHTMTDGQLPSLLEVVPPIVVPSSYPRGATIHPRSQPARHMMIDGQLPSLPEVVPPTVVPSSHPRGATIHPRSRPVRHTTSYDHSPHDPVRLTQTSSCHTRPTNGQSNSLHTSSSTDGVTLPLTSGSTTTTSKKGRGAARPNPIWVMGQILEVEFNEYMQPVGESGVKLVSQLGCIARDCERVPLTYMKWTDMPKHVLEDIWREVKDNTNVPDEYKHDCLRKVGVLWKERKAHLKQIHYYAHDTDEERLVVVPNKVFPNQGQILVRYWGTKEAEALVQKNTTNRAKQDLMHKTGRQYFANLRKEA